MTMPIRSAVQPLVRLGDLIRSSVAGGRRPALLVLMMSLLALGGCGGSLLGSPRADAARQAVAACAEGLNGYWYAPGMLVSISDQRVELVCYPRSWSCADLISRINQQGGSVPYQRMIARAGYFDEWTMTDGPAVAGVTYRCGFLGYGFQLRFSGFDVDRMTVTMGHEHPSYGLTTTAPVETTWLGAVLATTGYQDVHELAHRGAHESEPIPLRRCRGDQVDMVRLIESIPGLSSSEVF